MKVANRSISESLDDEGAEHHIRYAALGAQVNPLLDVIPEILEAARSLNLLQRHGLQIGCNVLVYRLRQCNVGSSIELERDLEANPVFGRIGKVRRNGIELHDAVCHR